MSGGRVTIGGTNYQIVGGRAQTPSWSSIPRGKVTVNGTNYTIKLYPRNLKHLLKNLEMVDSMGNDLYTEDTVYVSTFFYGTGTYYLISITAGLPSIWKLVYNSSTKTVTATQFGDTTVTYARYNRLYIEGNGTNNLKIWHTRNGAETQAYAEYNVVLVMFWLKPNSYTVAEADSILSAVTYKRLATRQSGGSSATATVTTDTANVTGKIVYAVINGEPSFTYVAAYNNYQVLNYFLATNPSNLYMTSTTTGLSTNGTSNTGVLNGAIGTFE